MLDAFVPFDKPVTLAGGNVILTVWAPPKAVTGVLLLTRSQEKTLAGITW